VAGSPLLLPGETQAPRSYQTERRGGTPDWLLLLFAPNFLRRSGDNISGRATHTTNFINIIYKYNCKGSGNFPVLTDHGSSLHLGGSEEGIDGSSLDAVGEGRGYGSGVFSPAFCVDPILKRIPKGARLMAGSVLENVLSGITDDLDDRREEFLPALKPQNR